MQTTEVTISTTDRFTRTDYVALRYWLNKVPMAVIADRCYPSDDYDPETATYAIRERLTRLRDWICEKLAQSNPHLRDTLSNARERGVWSRQLQDLLFEQEQSGADPLPTDRLGAWFRAPVVSALQAVGILTVGDLHQWILQQRHTWFYRIPRLGPGRANSIVQWLLREAPWAHEVALAVTPPAPAVSMVQLRKDGPIVPLERMLAPARTTGGLNASRLPPLVYAPDDVALIRTYLLTYQDSPETYRAYKKELERYVAWALVEHGKGLRDLMIEDCEAYKQFLRDIPARWTHWAKRAVPRSHPDWRPFNGQLSLPSISYAIKVIKKFHAWALKVRYLGGDPWDTVKEPRKATGLLLIQAGRALPQDTWLRLCSAFEHFASPEQDARTERGPWLRAAHVAFLLGGASGLRREEIAEARVCDIAWNSAKRSGQVDMAVLGKGMKWRLVILTPPTLQAIQAHWKDWPSPPTLSNMTDDRETCPRLLSPLKLGGFPVVRRKHQSGPGNGYSTSGIYTLLKGAFAWLCAQEDSGLTPEDCQSILGASTHALRHTFGSNSASLNAPIKQIQMLLGHASLETTTIYTNLERDILHEGVLAVEKQLQARKAALRAEPPDDASLS